MNGLARLFIVTGIICLLLGLLLLLPLKNPFFFFGKLPGDITYHKGNSTFFMPFTSMLIVSVLISFILNIISRFFR